MLFSTSTNLTQNIGDVSTSLFSSISPYVILVMGITLAFYVAEKLIDFVYFRDVDKEIQKTKEVSKIVAKIKELE